LSAVAIRDGIRREKDTSGYGSIAMDVNDDKVAPWCVDECSGNAVNKLDVITATGWAVSRNNERRRSRTIVSGVVLRHRPWVAGRNPQVDTRNIKIHIGPNETEAFRGRIYVCLIQKALATFGN
jgi:hypothetical protein